MPAKKVATKKVAKPATLLEGWQAGLNPHKTGGKWNKAFAYAASMEFASKVDARMTPEEVMALMAQYVPLAGWKNPAKALAAKYGLTKYNSPLDA